MEKKIDLEEFIYTLKNRTNENGKGLVLKHEDKPIAVLMAYEDYLLMVKSQNH